VSLDDETLEAVVGGGRPRPGGPDRAIPRYELGETLGSGGMATVVLARDRHLGRNVAIKLMRPELAEDPEARRLFEEEALILAGLEHPGTVPVHDAGTLETGEPFYAMKRVQGRTLKDLLSARRPGEIRSRQSITHFVDVFERVCQTLAAAHRQGLVHRDVKPANIMVDDMGSVYLVDWGLAVRLEGEGRSRAHPGGSIAGTPAYMSPEQARAAPTSPTSDVFSLGTVLYEILTGANPFSSADVLESMRRVREESPAPPVAINRAAGRALSAVCMKALARDPSSRYGSAMELAEEIRRYREFGPVEAAPPTFLERAANWIRRHPAVASAAAAALGVALLGGAGVAVRIASRHSLHVMASQRLNEADASLARVDAEIARAAAARQAATPTGRARFELELDELRALRAEEYETVHGLAYAILGFGASSPDRVIQARVRRYQIEGVERYLAAGQELAAAASLRRALRAAEAANPLGFARGEIAAMEAKLMQVETRLATSRGLESEPAGH
jgi:hypothetical protein